MSGRLEVLQPAIEILNAHRTMAVSTVRPDGWPQATTVGYVSDGLTLYFICGRDSQKARNLAADDRVSLTIDHDTSDPMAIAGLSIGGRAYPVTDTTRIRRAMFEMLPKKYPEYEGMMAQVDAHAIAVFRVEPAVISVLDYTKGFGHADLVRPEPSELAAA
jgi:nitroimidazol reductase NimA-like FMN-containing flavoprotein (pyridoxamine 5'-phosphate oxidase superfamily)